MVDIVDGMMAEFGDAQPPEGAEVQPPGETAPVSPQAEPPASPPPQPEPPQRQPPAGYIPLAAVLDEREKRRDLERQLQEIRAQQKPQAAPSLYEDPEAYQAAVDQKIVQIELKNRFDFSERFAVQQHGMELVRSAQHWAVQQDPFVKQAIFNDPDPVATTVARYRQHLALQQVGDDPTAWARKWAEENGYVAAGSPQATPPVPQQPAPKAPPRSIANTPAAAGSKVTEGEIGLDAGMREVFAKGR